MKTADITADSSYLDDNVFAPDTLDDYFTTGETYNGKSQKPTIKDLASAQALWGEDLAPAEGQTEQEFLDSLYGKKYTVEWQAGTYANYKGSTTTAITNADYQEIVAGKHYYRIVDVETGSVICYKHLYSIDQYEITGAIIYNEETATFVIGAVSFDPYVGFVDGKEYTWSTKNISGIAMGGEGVVKVGTLTPKVTLDYKDADGNPWIQSSSLAACDNTLSGKVAESGFWQYDGKDIDLNNNKISANLDYVAECYALPTTYAAIDSETTRYYGSIVDAIKNTSSGTIYPMQTFSYSIEGTTLKGTKTVGTTLTTGNYYHKITEQCTIQPNVTLCIPYGTDYSKYFTKDELINKDKNGDINAFRNQKFLKNEVVIESLKDAQGNVVKDENGNVVPTLINKGTLQIPGEVSGGNGSAKYNSITAGDHSQITLGDDAVVSNPTGTIQCYGFIAEETYDNRSKVEMTGGSMDVVFSIVEHRGGTILSGMISDLQSTPFNRFYIQTVTSTLVVHEGAAVSGFYDIYISLGHQYGKIGFFGDTSDVFFQLDPNDGKSSQVTLRYDTNKQQNQLDVYGSVNFNNISLSTSYGDISTAKVFLPMSHYWKVQCNKFISGDAATVTALAQDIKILPGGSVTISEGVTFKGRKIVVYSTTAPQIPDNDGASTYVYNTKADGTAVTATDGVLCVNGSLEVQYLGGFVQAGAEGATLKISSGVSVTSKEITGKYTDITHVIIPGIYYNNANPTVSASGDLAEGTAIKSKQPLSVNVQYKSSGSAWAYQRSITISYNVNGSTVAPVTAIAPKSETLWSNEGITLSGDYVPTTTLTRDYYTFDKWTIASDGSAASGKTVYSSTELKATWIGKDNNGTIVHINPNGKTEEAISFKSDATVPLPDTRDDPTNSGYKLQGWYKDAACTIQVKTSIFGEDLIANGSTIYAKWVSDQYEIKFITDKYGTEIDLPLDTYEQFTAFEAASPPNASTHTGISSINANIEREFMFSHWTYTDASGNVHTISDYKTLWTHATDSSQRKFELVAVWVAKPYVVYTTGSLTAGEFNSAMSVDAKTLYFTADQLATAYGKLSAYEGTARKDDTDVTKNMYFKGWAKSDGAILTSLTANDFVNGPITLTAKWGTKHTLSISITLDRTQCSGSVTVVQGTTNLGTYTSSKTLYFNPNETVKVSGEIQGYCNYNPFSWKEYNTTLIASGGAETSKSTRLGSTVTWDEVTLDLSKASTTVTITDN